VLLDLEDVSAAFGMLFFFQYCSVAIRNVLALSFTILGLTYLFTMVSFNIRISTILIIYIFVFYLPKTDRRIGNNYNCIYIILILVKENNKDEK